MEDENRQFVIEEHDQLKERLEKLSTYLEEEMGHERDDDRRLLVEQERHMTEYLEILEQRIARFK